MYSKVAKLAVVGLGVSFLSGASAAIQFTSRYSEFDITFSDPQFSNASVHYTTTFGVTGNAGDTLNAFVPLKPLTTSSGISSTGGVTFSNLVTTPGVSETFTMATDGTVGTITGSSNVTVGASFLQSLLVGNVQGGLPALSFLSVDTPAVGGLMAAGSRYDLDVKINGNWTDFETNPANVHSGTILGTSLNFAGGWSFDQPFAFDGSETVIHFHNDNYTGFNTPGLGFTLFGAPADVPEPGIPALVGLGLAALVVSRRRSGS